MTAARVEPEHCAQPARRLLMQVVSLSRNFGKEAALMAGLDHARLGAVLFMDGDGQHSPTLVETLVGHWIVDGYDVVYTAKAHRENESALRRIGVHWFYGLINWRCASENSGGRRRFPPAVAARRQCLASDAGAQPLLQGPVELDRLSPGARRLRAGGAREHGSDELWRASTGWPVDRRLDLVLGGAAARRQPARRADRLHRACCSAHRSCGRRSSTANQCRAIRR